VAETGTGGDDGTTVAADLTTTWANDDADATTVDTSAASSDDAGSSGDTTGAPAQTLALDFVFIHGVKSCAQQQTDAANSLVDLDAALQEALPDLAATFESQHPGVTLAIRSAAVNVYLADPSPDMPPGADPTQIDHLSVGYDGCGSQTQGDPCTTAYEWRYRVRAEIDALLPDADNLVLVGHSTGARTAVDLAADVGPGGIGTGGWGMGDRILGTVAVHGMIDSLDNYDLIGPFGFQSVCKTGGGLLGVFGGCDPGDGWCEYAAGLSGVDATNWVAAHAAALTLTSVQDCGVAFFGGESDGSLPIRAQSAAFANGLALTPVPGTTWGPAHGVRYGGFCHSAIDTPSTEGHDMAVSMARDAIASWLFVAAPRVVAEGSVETESNVAPGETTAPIAIGEGPCPADAGEYDVVVQGVRLHPGGNDGDDTPIAPAQIQVQRTGDCEASFVWTHDPAETSEPTGHRARFFWKIAADTDRGALARRLAEAEAEAEAE
jgi:hypothetical protein